jgi:hypothetical protein
MLCFCACKISGIKVDKGKCFEKIFYIIGFQYYKNYGLWLIAYGSLFPRCEIRPLGEASHQP